MLFGFLEVIIFDEFRDFCFYRVKVVFVKVYFLLLKLIEEIIVIVVLMFRYVKDLF